MKKFVCLLPALIASLLVCGSTFAAPANVVVGNLGSNATGGLAGANSSIGATQYAMGFTTSGTSNFNLVSVIVGLGLNSGTNATTVSLFGGAAAPTGSALWTSNSVDVSAQQRYTFTGPGFTLSPGSTYWVVPSTGVDWYASADFSAPVAQNGSGFSVPSPASVQNGGSGWTSYGLNHSVSVQAVPEPTTLALAAVGIVGAGLAAYRRRKSRSRS